MGKDIILLFVTFFLAVTLWLYVAVIQNGTKFLEDDTYKMALHLFGDEMNMKGCICCAYRKIELLCLYK